MPGVVAFSPEATEQGPETENWLEIYRTGMVAANELHKIELPHHPLLLGEWFAEADLGFVFASRGVGKTHLCIGMARALAEGTIIGPWKAAAPVPVLYFDGEMNAEQIRARDRALANGDGKLFYVNHQLFFHRTGKTLNLTKEESQDGLTHLLQEMEARVLFLDNLSTLFPGVAENDNDAWEAVLPWLLQLRRLGIAVVIVAHAGRNGQMRGASRREDTAAWVLRLDDGLDVATSKRGAKFRTVFTKPSRHTAAEIPPYEWEFVPKESGRCEVAVRAASGLEVFLNSLEQGLETCTDIAEEMKIGKGTVSKLAKQAEKKGYIRIEGRKYVLAKKEVVKNEPH